MKARHNALENKEIHRQSLEINGMFSAMPFRPDAAFRVGAANGPILAVASQQALLRMLELWDHWQILDFGFWWRFGSDIRFPGLRRGRLANVRFSPRASIASGR